jgi:hypothetical protein
MSDSGQIIVALLYGLPLLGLLVVGVIAAWLWLLAAAGGRFK